MALFDKKEIEKTTKKKIIPTVCKYQIRTGYFQGDNTRQNPHYVAIIEVGERDKEGRFYPIQISKGGKYQLTLKSKKKLRARKDIRNFLQSKGFDKINKFIEY